jgi:hypothetical protein
LLNQPDEIVMSKEKYDWLKIERTVQRHAAGLQYVNIIGFSDSLYSSHVPIDMKELC